MLPTRPPSPCFGKVPLKLARSSAVRQIDTVTIGRCGSPGNRRSRDLQGDQTPVSVPMISFMISVVPP